MNLAEIAILVIVIAAGVLALVELVNDGGRDLVAWAVLLIAIALLVWRLNL